MIVVRLAFFREKIQIAQPVPQKNPKMKKTFTTKNVNLYISNFLFKKCERNEQKR